SPMGSPALRRRRGCDCCCTGRPCPVRSPSSSSAARIAVEYEGAWHGETPQQVAADRRRLDRLAAAGWTVVFVTAADLQRPELLVARIAAALVR
ncbi:MAG: hypothetical protein ACXVGE_21880, partial [Blastococcus sp.]